VISNDETEDGDVPPALNIGGDEVNIPYDEPALNKIRLKSCSAAAGSVDQLLTEAVVVRSVRVEVAPPGLQTDNSSTLNVSTQTGQSHGLSDVMLDRIESYVQRSPIPRQTRSLLPGLIRFLPGYDPATLTVALTTMIQGVRLSAEVILDECAAQLPLRFEGRDVMMLEDRVVHLLRASGSEPVV